MSSVTERVAGAAAMWAALAGAARAELPTHHDLPLAMAVAIAQGAVESCAGQGYAVSAVGVDRNGDTVVAVRGDDARAYTMENARRKARTAADFRVATAEYAKCYAYNDPVVRQQVTLPGVIASSGGLPIKLGDEVIGGAGVSGSTGVDEHCARAGLDRISDRLR